MSKICVNTEYLEQQWQQLEKVARELQNISEEVSYVNHNLSWQISSRSQIKAKLNDYSAYIGTMQSRTGGLSAALQSVSQQYQNTEKKLGAVAIKGESTQRPDTSGTTQEKEENEEKPEKKPLWSWSDTWKLAGQFGITGATVAVIGELITGGRSVKNGLKTGKNILSLIEKIGKAASKPSFDWRTLFGFDQAITDASSKTLFGAIGDELKKLKFSNAKTVGDKISVGAKWAGYAMTGILTAYDNFTDEENSTFGRKLAETIGETTVKIAEGIVLKAAIGATCAALGVGAPAVVIGGAVVLATWGIDKAMEHFTEKNFAEFVSDTVLDTGKAMIDKAGEMIKNVGATAKKAGDAIGGWWKSFGRSFAPA
ncbi:hypothetical protein ACTM90_09990 [Oliverpabstia intestinalis]|uniref:hypothetical protein n=1 Tax=Oliverpabstia intestinalis TaxID=2606633 RepID=UPI003F8BFA92